MINHLIFDCDGVLIDSEIIAAQAMVEQLNSHGIPITITEYFKNCTGKTFSGLKADFSARHGVTLPKDFVQIVIGKLEILKIEQLKPVEGILDLLDGLQDFRKAVVSNSDLNEIKNSLTQVKALHHFGNNVFSSEQVENAKPSPDVYLYSAKELNVNPEECLVIEDSISGATAAISAGMQVVGFLAGNHIVTGHEDRLKNIGVEMVAYSAIELEGIINQAMR